MVLDVMGQPNGTEQLVSLLLHPHSSPYFLTSALESLAFNLKYLPVTVAQDNGAGDQMSHGDTEIQGRVQVLHEVSWEPFVAIVVFFR